MGLRKSTEGASGGLRKIEARDYVRDGPGLAEQLRDPEVSTRRWAARDLADFPEYGKALCECLPSEPEPSVREVIFTSLTRIGGHAVVDGLLPLLRSEDPSLRNGAIEALGGMPHDVGHSIDRLLRDNDVDVRIFTVNLLGELKHEHVVDWIGSVLRDDPHVNVVAAALEVLAEVGNPKLLPELMAARKRFPNDAFIGFAADVAQERIEAA